MGEGMSSSREICDVITPISKDAVLLCLQQASDVNTMRIVVCMPGIFKESAKITQKHFQFQPHSMMPC
jgi:hypothetical protein